ncbi:MAG: class I SAM-dependent methyltransferase [bacterium]|nr:class I SAM-dependent methyltransferase [bacterium]
MVWQEPLLDRIGALYGQCALEFGATTSSVGWLDETVQTLRFQKLTMMIAAWAGHRSVHSEQQPWPEITVNDWGCGYGALFAYLDSRPEIRLTRYYGYDISKEMLASAAEHITDDRAEWILAEAPTKEADFSIISGTFNVCLDLGEQRWASYIEQALVKAAKMSRKGFAFNLLSIHADQHEKGLFYGDPVRFYNFCRRSISSRVALLNDYPIDDWTIYALTESDPEPARRNGP